jgi:hypothetical protein
VPEGHFLLQNERQFDRQPFRKAKKGLYHPRHGRPGYPPLVLFKASLLQRWYNLSDPGLEETTGRNYGFLIASVCHFCSSYASSTPGLKAVLPESPGAHMPDASYPEIPPEVWAS